MEHENTTYRPQAGRSSSTAADHTVAGKKVVVIGAQRSGIAAAALLKKNGARVFVSDGAPAEKLREQTAQLDALDIAWEANGHTGRVYEADLVVVSPGVPSTAPVLVEADERGLRIVSELEMASWFSPAPIVAITGTNGKTTTTTLAGRMFHDAKRSHIVAGNIGNAFSSAIDELNEDSIAVLEVSSFQLDHIESFRPKVSVILNITPDHLDRYDGIFSKYAGSKCRIFENQTPADILIYNDDDDETREHVRRLASLHVTLLPFALTKRFDEGAYVENGMLVTVVNNTRADVIETAQISIRGIHNLYNSMAAALAAQAMGVSVPSIRATLKNFKGVEHRLEYVRELNGVKYINDSKATNVASVWYALQAFDEPLVLLLGGRDKGNDYSQLFDLARHQVRAIVAIGESADTVVEEFSPVTDVVKASSMPEAVKAAQQLARTGEVVLLSPACASFDWFNNYEHRGRVFKELVNAL